jgi:predicted PurR-regulated permease PerM
MRPRWTETTKRMVVVIGVVLGFVLLYLGRSTLVSLLLAAVVAYALLPLVSFLHRRLRFPHVLATVIVYLLMLAILATIPLILVPVITNQVRALNLNLMTLFSEGREWLRATLLAWRTVQIGDGVVDLSTLVDPALRALGEQGAMPALPSPEQWLPDLFGRISGLAFTVTSATLSFFLILLYSFYMVKDGPSWGRQLDQLVPEAYRPEFDQLQAHLNMIWGAFFRGQLLFCLIIAVAIFIALSALGVSGSIFLALVVGVLEIIPNIGPLIALVPIALVTLIQGSSTLPLSDGWATLIVILVYAVIQIVGANILAPIIIGGSVDLPPLIMLIAVVIGASVAGLIGAFLATPLVATLRVLAMYAYNKVLDRDPFPEIADKKEKQETPVEPPPKAAAAPPVEGDV